MEPVLYEVEIKEKEKTGSELSDDVATNCCFCEKNVHLSIEDFNLYVSLGQDEFHCPFCLRHKHHHRDASNILLMSFKGMIGHYFHHCYHGTKRTMWISEIKELVEAHAETGLLNPVFNYDPDTFMWFVDFNRIGKTYRKIPIENIHETIEAIIGSLKPDKISNFTVKTYVDKFKEAVDIFYKNRQRPTDKRILCPTLSNCIFYQTNQDFEITKRVGSYIFYVY